MLVRLAPLALRYLLDRLPLGYRTKNSGDTAAGTASRSTVKTRHLIMVLDHLSGHISGRVIAGRYEGRHLHELSPTELQHLYTDYAGQDDESARLLKAYLERVQTGTEPPGHSTAGGGVMAVAEALEILGLAEGCSSAEIQAAHRRLIQKLHPDRGGSSYLAAKINQARDILLKHC
ncbi:MAG: DnaJ domain-containing protein [Methylococcaceae bacterium]